MATPFLLTLRRECSDAVISVVCRTYVADIFRRSSAVDVLMEYDSRGGIRSELSVIRKRRPKARWDTCYVLPPSFSSALAARLSGASRRIGYAGDWRGFLLTRAMPRSDLRERHLSHDYVRLIDGTQRDPGNVPLPVVVPPYQWRRDIDEMGLAGDYFVCAAGAAYGRAKVWPLERYASLAAALVAKTGWRAVAVGSAAERPAAAEILEAVAGPSRNLAGAIGVEDLLSVLRGARAVVGNDSGPVHIAAAMGVPVVAVFGSTSPAWTAPRGAAVGIVTAGVDCAPCFKRECPRGDPLCLTEIEVEDVLKALSDVVGKEIH
jgi:heptosyltransferase-2